eukprot:254082_1
MAVFMFNIIIYVLLSHIVYSKCEPRHYGVGGSKGKPNKKLDKEIIEANMKTCNPIKTALECAKNNKHCLWPDDDALSILEGPTIKSAEYIPTTILPKDQFQKEWKKRSKGKPKDINIESKMTEKAFEQNVIVTTIDRSEIMYKIQFTDFADRMKLIGNAFRKWRLKTIKSKLKRKRKPVTKLFSLSKKIKSIFTRRHSKVSKRRTRKPLINLRSRRRLADRVGEDDVGNAPFRSVGLIKVGVDGSATGTVIAVTPIDNTHQYIYVLCAAHDLVLDDGRTLFAAFDQYKFYPGIDQMREAERDGIYFGQYANPTHAGVMERAWIISSYRRGPKMNIDAYHFGDQFDVGVMEFKIPGDPDDIVIHPLGFEPDNDMPNNVGDHNKDMIMMDIAGAGQNKQYTMETQRVNIYCTGGGYACYYNNVPIKTGYCGGPIINADRISAIQVAFKPLHDGEPADCTAAGDVTNCKGIAARITRDRAMAIAAVSHGDITTWYEAQIEYENIYNVQYEIYNDEEEKLEDILELKELIQKKK